MKTTVRKLAAVAFAAVAVSLASAAATHFEKVGYEVEKGLVKINGKDYIGIVYEQFDDAGKSTGIVVSPSSADINQTEGLYPNIPNNPTAYYGLEPYAVAEVRNTYFEKAYPNREYGELWVDGKKTEYLVYTGVQLGFNYRWSNNEWELAAPHRVYQKLQANIAGQWYTDGTYPSDHYAGSTVSVKSEYKNFYGFGYWHIADTDKDGKADSIEDYMPSILQPYAAVNEDIVAKDINGTAITFTDALAPGAITNLTGFVDVEIEKAFSLELAGPKFNFDGSVTPGNEYALVKSAADIAEGKKFKDYTDLLEVSPLAGVIAAQNNLTASQQAAMLKDFAVSDLVKYISSPYGDVSKALVNYEWVDAGFEYLYPFRLYQILKVDNILLDGRTINNVKLPYIYRYTGGFANPSPVKLVSSWFETPAASLDGAEYANYVD